MNIDTNPKAQTLRGIFGKAVWAVFSTLGIATSAVALRSKL
jgi:hypothetical protein